MANRPDAPIEVLRARQRWPLAGVRASRAWESAALQATPAHTLIERAGLAVARLCAALSPHDRRVWLACGPGNNGGDGLIAAAHLQRWGWQVQVGLVEGRQPPPDDARHALQRAREAGVPIGSPDGPPTGPSERPALAVDALLGLGAARPPEGAIAAAARGLAACGAPVLAVDLPTGLAADTGERLGDAAVLAQHTLTLLTLKPGLFTAAGRELAGRIWFDDLGLQGLPGVGPAWAAAEPEAWLLGPPRLAGRPHGRHKGSHGDLLVLGGAPGMSGAAVLAARAALAAGAGRVYLARLDDDPLALDAAAPELMPRRPADAVQPAALGGLTVVCGCGGGAQVAAWLPAVLAHAGRLLLDADALNAVAREGPLARTREGPLARTREGPLARLLQHRPAGSTVLTPHPLEAARLLGCSTAEVQADRPAAARELAQRLHAVVVLKGSGSVVAAPAGPIGLNPTGNARLATPGTGDVLAGWIGGLWAAGAAAVPDPAEAAWAAATAGVWLHGRAAEDGDDACPGSPCDPLLPLPAAALLSRLVQVTEADGRASPG